MPFSLSKDLPVQESFQKFLTAINPTQKQQENIRATRQSIDSVLVSDPLINLNNQRQISFLTGSYSRNTIIRPIDDIDLYVRVHYGHHGLGQPPIRILRKMAVALRKRYPNTKIIKVDAPCVIVNFLGYRFELVPAIGYDENPDLYDIPAPGAREWMQCYPNVPNVWLSNSNFINNGMFVPLIKMIKQWNRNHNVGFKSFHIELLTERVFADNPAISSYPCAVYEWFLCVNSWIENSSQPFINEPGKWYSFVDQYLYNSLLSLGVVKRKLKVGLKRAERAWLHYLDDNPTTANLHYHRLFGPKFPAPKQKTNTTFHMRPHPIPSSQPRFRYQNYQGVGLLDAHLNSSIPNLLGNQHQSNVNAQSYYYLYFLDLLLKQQYPYK